MNGSGSLFHYQALLLNDGLQCTDASECRYRATHLLDLVSLASGSVVSHFVAVAEARRSTFPH